jgi:DNA-binding GntR family transcriptional regulator
LFDAIEIGDADRAESLARTHVASAKAAYVSGEIARDDGSLPAT